MHDDFIRAIAQNQVGRFHAQLGREYLAQSLIPEAEREFQAAITADSNSSPAHAGIAEVREQSGSADQARTEAHRSLDLHANVDAWMVLARRWSKAFGILFAVGAVSGTVLSFELGLLWPGFMRYAGAIIGMPFSLEGFAFFTEAIFPRSLPSLL